MSYITTASSSTSPPPPSPSCCGCFYVIQISYAIHNDSTTRMGAILVKIIQTQTWRTHKQKHHSSFNIYTQRMLAKELMDMEGITALRMKPSYRDVSHSQDAILAALR